jgi:hypothetical protein
MLLLDHEPLPWTRWGQEFAAAMSEEIRRLQEHAAATDATPRHEAIRGRVASILPLYRLSRYRPTQPPRPSSANRRPRRSAYQAPRAKRAAATAPTTKDADGVVTGGAASPNTPDGEPPADARDREDGADAIAELPDVAWISGRSPSGDAVALPRVRRTQAVAPLVGAGSAASPPPLGAGPRRWADLVRAAAIGGRFSRARALARSRPMRRHRSRLWYRRAVGMPSAMLSVPVEAASAGRRKSRAVVGGDDTPVGLLSAAGNRAMQRALAPGPRERKLTRCAGACRCGGTCEQRSEADEDVLAAGGRALRRAVLARDRRNAPPPPAPASSGSNAPGSDQLCGPDVTQAVTDVVAQTKADYAGWSEVQKNEACAALENWYCAGDAWDIVELHNRGWLDSYAPCSDKGGACKNTVMVDGSCSYAGSVNYVIFGAMCALCGIWESTMEDMIWAYKGGSVWPWGHGPSANYGPSLAWARAGYDGWPAVSSPAGDRPACTQNCAVAYHSGPMHLHWYPTAPTETVKPACEEWAREYDAMQTSPPSDEWLGGGF